MTHVRTDAILFLGAMTLAGACSVEAMDPPRDRTNTANAAGLDLTGSQADVYRRVQGYCGAFTSIDSMIASRCASCHQGAGHDGVVINAGDPAGNLRVLVEQGLDAPGSALVPTYLSGKHEPLTPPLSACELDAIGKWTELGAPPRDGLEPVDPPPVVVAVGVDGGPIVTGGDAGAVSLQDTLFHTKVGAAQRSVEDVLMACRLCHTTGPGYVDAAGKDFSLAKKFLQFVPMTATSWPTNLAAIKKVVSPSTPPQIFRLHVPNTTAKPAPKPDLAQIITVKPGRLMHESANYPGSSQADLALVNAWLAAYGK